MRIAFVVSKPEYEEIKRRAGLVPLSIWIRHVLLEGVVIEKKPRAQRKPRKPKQRPQMAEIFAGPPPPMTPPPGYAGDRPVAPLVRHMIDVAFRSLEPPQPERMVREVEDEARVPKLPPVEEHRPPDLALQDVPESLAEDAGRNVQEMDGDGPRCCSRPQVVDGVCLQCGAGATSKVQETLDGHVG